MQFYIVTKQNKILEAMESSLRVMQFYIVTKPATNARMLIDSLRVMQFYIVTKRGIVLTSLQVV